MLLAAGEFVARTTFLEAELFPRSCFLVRLLPSFPIGPFCLFCFVVFFSFLLRVWKGDEVFVREFVTRVQQPPQFSTCFNLLHDTGAFDLAIF